MRTGYKLLLSVLLAWAQVIVPSLIGRVGDGASLSAQDAFYIYRNDGEFDGFFFDDVIRMGYSKIDPQGVEHEEYVIQEIETEDSLYRIPLCAIDSIGFQQPEIIFSPKVKHIDQMGLKQYMKDFTAYQDRTAFFRLNADTPAELVPQEGDVLVNFSDPSLGYGGASDSFTGFACKVTSISRYNEWSQWSVRCEPVTELADIFVQLISVERLGYDEQGNVKRRVAGFDYDETTRRFVPRKENGSGSISLFDVSGTLKREAAWGSVNADFSIKAGFDVTYNINWRRVYFKLGRSFGFSLTPSATLKTGTDFECEITGIPEALSSIKFPAMAPLFQTRPFPKVFFRGGGELAVKLSLPTVGYNYHESVSYDSDKTFPFSFSMFDGKDEGSDQELFNTGDIEFSLSGFVQAGTKFTGGVETNDWFKSIMWAYIGLELYAGPKIEGSVSLSAARLLQQGAYESLTNSKIAFHAISLDLAAKARSKFLWQDPDETTLFETSKQFGTKELYLFPTFKDTKVTFDQESGAVNCSTTAERSVFWKSHLGFGAYKGGELTESVFPATCLFGIPAKAYSGGFAGLTPGRYQIMPVVKTFDFILPVTSQAKDIVVTPYLKLSPHELHFTEEGGSASVSIDTNAETFGVGSPQGHMTRNWTEKAKSFTVTAPFNHSIFKLEQDVNVWGRSTGVGQVWDNVTITQDGNSGSAIKSIFLDCGSQTVGRTQFPSTGIDNFRGIPCSASRNGDFLTISGSYSKTDEGEERYSVNMTIDCNTKQVISGEAHIYTSWPDPKPGQSGMTAGYCSTDITFSGMQLEESEYNRAGERIGYYKYKAGGKQTIYHYEFLQYENGKKEVRDDCYYDMNFEIYELTISEE